MLIMDDAESNNQPLKKGLNYIPLFFVLFIILIVTLPFHYVIGDFKMFPKENLTFSHTFIFKSDIDKIIEDYNQSGFVEKIQMRADPFYKKLLEEGLIVEEKPDSTKHLPRTSESESLTTDSGSSDTDSSFTLHDQYTCTDTTLVINSYRFYQIDILPYPKSSLCLVSASFANINDGSIIYGESKDCSIPGNYLHFKTYNKKIGAIEFAGKFKNDKPSVKGQILLEGNLNINNHSKYVSFKFLESSN